MNFANLNTHNDEPAHAFEALCNQLFERWVRANYPNQVKYFLAVNGNGGDGGVEAYAELASGFAVGVQSKWFRGSFQNKQIGQIRRSVNTAMDVREHLRRYIICIPRSLQSKRRGRGQQVTANVEAQRFQDLLSELAYTYPTLAIDLWDEHRIQEELQVPGNEGIRRFWFEHEEISLASLHNAFHFAKTGWLSERYSPDLHHQGMIQLGIRAMLFTPAYRQVVVEQVEQVIVELSEAMELVEVFKRLATPSNTLEIQLQLLQAHWRNLGHQFHQIKQAVWQGQFNLELVAGAAIDTAAAAKALAAEQVPTTLRNLKPRLLAVITALGNRQLAQLAVSLLGHMQPHHLVALGRPGTGKTHGLAKAVEQQLQAGLPAIIIRAKGTPSSDWATILRNTLGGLTTWSTEEIFSGLEALAVRADSYRARAFDAKTALVADEPTRLLLCIDGAEEAQNTEDWKTRAKELRALLSYYPRLRVIISSRAYLSNTPDPINFDCDTVVRKLDLPTQGDVPVEELVPVYLREYNIGYEQLPWLTSAFRDALSLRLFAETYRNQDLSHRATPIKTTLSALLSEKEKLIEQAFVRSGQLLAVASDSLARKGMMSIANSLDTTDEVEHEVLCQQLVADLPSLISRPQAALMLEIYADYGLILQLKTKADEEDYFDETRITYTFSFQPIVDYFIALKATRQIVVSGSKSLPEILLRREDNNALELTAVALLTDYDRLVGEEGYWVDEVEEEYLNDLKYLALSNASDNIVQRYLPLVIINFGRSDQDRNAVIQRFLLPTLYRTHLDLVVKVVHDTLLNFPSVFQRDLFWAGPIAYNSRNPKSDNSIRNILRREVLHKWQTARGLPLLFGWALATVDNGLREYWRSQLTAWGLHNPSELLKLLDLLYFCGDAQVQEDLSRVMFGVASLITTAGNGLEPLAAWLLRRVFAPDRIVAIRSSVVRACGRAIVELAISFGECAYPIAALARPPYPTTDELLPLDVEGLPDAREERFPIVHDLAWYVIDESYEGFLELKSKGRYTNAEAEDLMQQYQKAFPEELFSPHSFVMSAALAYIKALGYDRNPGEGSSTTQESGGSLSENGTLEEKYTWLAVRYLQGYFADLLPYEHYSKLYPRLPDYHLLVTIENPAAALVDPNDPEWYLPVDISPALQPGSATLAKTLKAWVNRKDQPDFATWLYLPGFQPGVGQLSAKTWRPLHFETQLSEPTNTGATTLEISCCLLAAGEWEPFFAYFKKHTKELQRHYFADARQLQADTTGPHYASVRDVIGMNWFSEDSSMLELYYNDDKFFTIHKTCVSVTESSLTTGTQYFVLPSKLVRQQLGIIETDKTSFRTSTGHTVAHFHATREENYDKQVLLAVDQTAFEQWCTCEGLKPFWIISQYQKTSLNFEDRGNNMYFRNFRYWLVWEENGILMHYQYHDGGSQTT